MQRETEGLKIGLLFRQAREQTSRIFLTTEII